jgi:hypothetical protein
MTRKRTPKDAVAAADTNLPQDIPAGPAIDRSVLMPGYRARHDGWTPERTQRFFDVLGHTGCVTDAARVAGMSVTGARRMRSLFPEFARAWDEALARAQQGLIAIAYCRAVEGKETVIIRKGEEVERRIAPSDSILGLLVKRGDALGEGGVSAKADEILTLAEWKENWRFDDWGKKYQQRDPKIAAEAFAQKMATMRDRLIHWANEGRTCLHCEQPWPSTPTNRSMAELTAAGVFCITEFDEET